MFERFTNNARRVIVLAQDEAREIPHNYIGTEHLLLGLIGEPRGLAGRALEGFGMSLAATREDVRARVPGSDGPAGKRIPFTPRAKKALELALREALQLNHNYIGTEHLLLGLLRERDGVAAAILIARCGSLEAVREAVLKLLPATPPAAARRWHSEPVSPRPGSAAEPETLHTTPAADSGLDEAARLAGSEPVGSHHLVLAVLADPGTAAARALAALGVNLDEARAALLEADVTGSTDELPEATGRRQMQLTAAPDRLTVELTDPAMVALGRAALDALSERDMLGDRDSQPPVIRGDLPVASSLSTVWLALRASLDDIRTRAAGEQSSEPPGAQAG